MISFFAFFLILYIFITKAKLNYFINVKSFRDRLKDTILFFLRLSLQKSFIFVVINYLKAINVSIFLLKIDRSQINNKNL